MKNKWSYGYIIRDKEGVAILQGEGYKTRKDVEQAAKEALSIMPEDSSLEIRYDSPVYKIAEPEVPHDLEWQEEVPPNIIIN